MPVQHKCTAACSAQASVPHWHGEAHLAPRAAGRVQAQVRAHRARRKGTGSGRHAQAQEGPGQPQTRPRVGVLSRHRAGSGNRARTVPAGVIRRGSPVSPGYADSKNRSTLMLDLTPHSRVAIHTTCLLQDYRAIINQAARRCPRCYPKRAIYALVPTLHGEVVRCQPPLMPVVQCCASQDCATGARDCALGGTT